MKTNVGATDKIIRFILAALFIVLIVTELVTGTWAWVLGIVAAAMVITALIGFCGLYALFGIKTCPTKK